MSPKTLQYLMVHVDISVTLNVYTHLGLKDAKAKNGGNRSFVGGMVSDFTPFTPFKVNYPMR